MLVVIFFMIMKKSHSGTVPELRARIEAPHVERQDWLAFYVQHEKGKARRR